MSGWSNMTVHPPSGLSPSAKRTAEENIEEYLSEYNKTPFSDPTEGYAERNVSCGDVRRHPEQSATEHANEVFEDCPSAGRVVFISVGDTAGIGYGFYFERRDGETVLVDSKEGYEGCRERDVVGYMRDEHGARGYSSYEA